MLKKIIRSTINKAGFSIYRKKSNTNPLFQLLAGLNTFNINIVLDIGANIGQFASGLRSTGFTGKLVSFEPLQLAHQSLVELASKDPNWIVHSRCAIGDHAGEIEINIAGNSVSSSILPMLDSHADAAPESAYVGSEKVPLCTLDTVIPHYLKETDRCFLKIDTQGFESQVLDGATKILPQIKGLLLETSLVELYEGQHLWLEMIQRLEKEGFTLWSLQQGFTDPKTGRSLQMDAIFFRET